MNYKQKMLVQLFNWVKINKEPNDEAGEKVYLWDSFNHQYDDNPIEISGRGWQILLKHAMSKSAIQDKPSAIEIHGFDVVIYSTGRPDEPDREFWKCRKTCTAHLWTETHAGAKTLPLHRRFAAKDEDFLKVNFRCSYVERQVQPKDLALYMRYGKTLQWVDEMATCSTDKGDCAYVIHQPCAPEAEILTTVPDEKWGW